jgi:hypothetical protein
MRKSILPLQRPMKFENLEARTLMAGNVTAEISEAGNLEILGDSNHNIVAVTQFNSGIWKVQGLLGTKINGKNSEKFEYSGGMDVSLGRGHDGFAIVKGNVEGALNIRTSSGIDGVVLTRLTAQSIYVNTGADTDALLVAKVTVQVREEQPETAAVLQSEAGTAIFQTSSGDDYVLIAKLTAPSVYVYTNAGRDIVGLLGVEASEKLHVNLGSGNLDILGAVKNSAPVANLFGGEDLSDGYFHAANTFEEENASGFELTQSFDAYFEQLESLVEAYLPLVQQLPGLNGLPNLDLF